LKINSLPRCHGGFFRLISKMVPISMFLFFIACDEPDEIGLDFIDNPVGIETSGFKIEAYSIPEDSVPTNYSSRNLLGFRNDPVFGSKKASIYTEFRLLENDLYFGDNPILDSVVLELYYSSYFGDYTTMQNVRVYELSENFPESDDGAFYSSLTIEHKEFPVSDTLVRPIPNDSVPVGEHIFAPHMRIRLSDDFGQKLIDGSDSQEHFADNTTFLDYFKGFHITVDELPAEEEGAILYFNLVRTGGLESNSAVRIYYHFEGDTVSSTRSFPVNEFAKRSTHIEYFDHENAHEHLKKQIIEGETTYGDSLLFLQSLAGANVFIDFPKDSLEHLSQKDVIINMARLIVPVDENFDVDEYYSEDTPIPSKLYILKKDKDGEFFHITDGSYGYFGGGYDEDNNEYSINITQHFQELINDPASNYGMVLVITESHSNAQRVVLKGPGRQDNPLRLELKYTILD